MSWDSDCQLHFAAGFGAATGFFGMVGSYYIDVASGAAIMMLQALIFGIVLAVTALRLMAQRRLMHTHV